MVSHLNVIPENMKHTREQEWKLPWSALLTRKGLPCTLQLFMLLDVRCRPSEWAKWTLAVQMDLIFVLMLWKWFLGKSSCLVLFYQIAIFSWELILLYLLGMCMWILQLTQFLFYVQCLLGKMSEYQKLISNYTDTNVVEFFHAFTFPLCFCYVCSVIII